MVVSVNGITLQGGQDLAQQQIKPISHLKPKTTTLLVSTKKFTAHIKSVQAILKELILMHYA